MEPNAALRNAIFLSRRTQRDIANRTRIRESRLSQIVRGWITATEAEQKALAKTLKLPIDHLFGNSENVGASR